MHIRAIIGAIVFHCNALHFYINFVEMAPFYMFISRDILYEDFGKE